MSLRYLKKIVDISDNRDNTNYLTLAFESVHVNMLDPSLNVPYL